MLLFDGVGNRSIQRESRRLSKNLQTTEKTEAGIQTHDHLAEATVPTKCFISIGIHWWKETLLTGPSLHSLHTAAGKMRL